MGYNAFLSYCSTIDIICSLPTCEKTRRRLLNLWSKSKTSCYVFSSYVFKNERKESKTPNTFDLMLEVRVVNFCDNPMLSSMRDSKEGLKFISSLALELTLMVNFREFNNNQC
jgi:hypothetical protein